MRWKVLSIVFAVIVILGASGFIYLHSHNSNQTTTQNAANSKKQNVSQVKGQTSTSSTQSPQVLSDGQKVYTQAELLAMASVYNPSQGIPLGDGKYTTTGAKKGYLYYCNTPSTNGGGAQGSAPWIIGNLWYPNQKPHVQGSITWSNATFSDIVKGTMRLLSGNGLPVGYTSGIFPIKATDPAYQYDKNPNSIKAHNVTLDISTNPIYYQTPNCMRAGGEIGVMLSGVVLFDAMDAEQRDAVAHEVQDSCDAHPQEAGIYHYHGLSPCFTNISEKHILGYAIDGFPITGPEVAKGKYLNSSDLDECHGITSSIIAPNGTAYTTYHYVMTYDFPYSISCYRGKPITLTVQNPTNQQQPSGTGNQLPPPKP